MNLHEFLNTTDAWADRLDAGIFTGWDAFLFVLLIIAGSFLMYQLCKL